MSRLVCNAKQLFDLNCGLESDVSVPPFEVSLYLTVVKHEKDGNDMLSWG